MSVRLGGCGITPLSGYLKALGVMVHRYTTKKHRPRGIFCAIGRCTDCVMVVDGVPNTRTCITPVREGMVVETQVGVVPASQVKDTVLKGGVMA